MKSEHQYQVEAFMLRAKQRVPVSPAYPTTQERLRMARVMLEEVLETIRDGLGISVAVRVNNGFAAVQMNDLHFAAEFEFDMIATIDGCMDTHVVTTCIMSGCGLPEQPFQQAVNANNLQKFGEGHSFREDGKLIKPRGHKPPDLRRILESLTA